MSMQRLIEHWQFASDAKHLAMIGLGLLLVAAIAFFADRRRVRRRHIDAVGVMPWTGIFLMAFFVGVPLLGYAIKGLLAP